MTTEEWICCGHDVRALCKTAESPLPARCFFCGKPRKAVALSPKPEDALAFELAEIWCGKIREYHGDPEAHFPSLDKYGRTDVEAWRAVARCVQQKIEQDISKSTAHQYAIHDSFGCPKGQIILLSSYTDKFILGKMKGLGLISAITDHWISGGGPTMSVVDPSGKHVLFLYRMELRTQ